MTARRGYARGYKRELLTPKELVAGYAQWVEDRVALGFWPTMLTFMFNEMPGSPAAVHREMHDIVERTYRRVLTRTERRPRSASASWETMPLWIGCIDWPVYKRFKDHFQNIAQNDGAHMHMMALTPPDCRMFRRGETLEQHIFDNNQQYYFGIERDLHFIQCETVQDNPGYVTDYALKALKSGRTNVDNMLVLPRAKAEL